MIDMIRFCWHLAAKGANIIQRLFSNCKHNMLKPIAFNIVSYRALYGFFI